VSGVQAQCFGCVALFRLRGIVLASAHSGGTVMFRLGHGASMF